MFRACIEDRAERTVTSHVEGTVRAFVDACAAKTPTPGGGAASALFAALGAALGSMAARFTAGKKGFEAHAATMEQAAARFDELRAQLLPIVDEDCRAYDVVTAAYALQKDTDDAKAARTAAIQSGLVLAMNVPLRGARLCCEGVTRIAELAPNLNKNLISDAGVCALGLGAAFEGFAMNVRINAAGLKDESVKAAALSELATLKSTIDVARAKALTAVEASF